MAKKKKVFVLDTNVLLHDYRCIYNFQENNVIVPITVLEELDKFKRGNDIINYHAREFTRELDKLSGDKLFNGGVSLGKGLGKLGIETGKAFSDVLKASFPEDTSDHRILAIADHISRNNRDNAVILISKDINLRMKAKSIGILAQDYETDKVRNIDDIYKSVSIYENLDDQLIMQLYEKPEGIPFADFNISVKPISNQYFILKGNNSSALAHYYSKTSTISRVIKEIITVSPINWRMRSIFRAPITLRTPTSFARVVDLAVLRFVKLMQAMRRTKRAMAEKISRVCIRPPP